MGSPALPWRAQVYGPERSRGLKSRLFVLLRDELGLGRQPKVAHLLVDEIASVVEATYLDASLLAPGQILLLATEVGQGPSWSHPRLEERRQKTVRLNLLAPEDVERLIAGERPRAVRLARLIRLIRECYEQGAALTVCQLALLTGISPSRVSSQLTAHMRETGQVLPLRGIVEDCSPAITHKAQIIARHLAGESTAQIARATSHTPYSVERYIRRFEQIRELVRYLRHIPEPAWIARLLDLSESLVRAYLRLLPAEERPGDKTPTGP